MLATLLYRLCWVLAAFITSAESYLQDEKIYTVSEVTTRPEPPDGLAAFQNKWSRNVKYPEEAVREKIQGMVFIEFIVKKNGTVTGSAIRSGIHKACDEAALNGFIKTTSKEPWKPGTKNGEPVAVKMVLPFSFRIIAK